jgi:hypothetical protein
VSLRRTVRERRGDAGQSLVEFAMVVTVVMLFLLGLLEFGFVFDHHLTLEYASREGARSGSALANGGGVMGCGAGQSPNAATVDPQIIAAVQRVLTSPGSQVVPSRVSSIRIYKADAAGNETGSAVNVWIYQAGGGPTVDGKALDFKNQSTGWTACSRDNGGTPDSIGVSVAYNYQLVTPLSAVMGFFGGGSGPTTIPMSDRTIMALNPGN